MNAQPILRLLIFSASIIVGLTLMMLTASIWLKLLGFALAVAPTTIAAIASSKRN